MEILLCQRHDNIISLPRYLLKVSKALLNTDKIVEPVAHLVKIEADSIVELSSKRE